MDKEKFKGIESFFSLVEKIARKYTFSGIEFEDLKQQGMLGLVEAFEACDPDRKKTFTAFAMRYIEGAIKHYIRDKSTLIRYPRWFRALSKKIENFIIEFQEKYNRFPNTKEIGNALNVQEEGVREFFRLKKMLYLQYFEEGESEENIDYNQLRAKIRHNRYESFKLPIEDVITLYNAIDKLSDLQKRIVYYIFFRGYTQKETAKEVGISQRHVSRVKKEALKKLKGELKD